ncbi:hypothetical protein BASA50_008095 [Batrachochytrium salamandrivorans]|uniref:Uncharacterized protein n=1 Tax=Batrachochytrium salamandrivorans TaxID=1357716 RepID=A0ABQ8F5A0_9FUNG|nr:hypothetical protein BASA62_004994 [Batrachochytrium salamandrivorans]KAH6579486.1 hypothetical protein BASA61_010238 [Batrachochytrium salamandrivorans]KAH6592479.1 hypothetical protein BASA50_008095 [Batrachochytrium salamandrivorans]
MGVLTEFSGLSSAYQQDVYMDDLELQEQSLLKAQRNLQPCFPNSTCPAYVFLHKKACCPPLLVTYTTSPTRVEMTDTSGYIYASDDGLFESMMASSAMRNRYATQCDPIQHRLFSSNSNMVSPTPSPAADVTQDSAIQRLKMLYSHF